MINSPTSSHQINAAIHHLVKKVFKGNINIHQLTDELNQWYVQFMHAYDDSLRYISSINAFLWATQRLVNHLYPDDVVWTDELAREFVYELKRYYPQYIDDKANHAHQEQDNSHSLQLYLSQLFTHHKRLLFVRVDLKYHTCSQGQISVRDFHKHMTVLKQRISNQKSCFKNLQGSAWALEQGGEDGGLHCHLLLIYDGFKQVNGWTVAKAVGKKWADITEGYGTHFNCHDQTYTSCYEVSGKLGIGMIHQDNEQEVNNALRTSSYLTRPSKYDQKLKVWLPNKRTFGHGQYRTKKRRGLPPISK